MNSFSSSLSALLSGVETLPEESFVDRTEKVIGFDPGVETDDAD